MDARPLCVPQTSSVHLFSALNCSPGYGDIDFAGLVMGCHAMPMFHGMGVLQISSAVRILIRQHILDLYLTLSQASSGLVIATFRPTSPATFPTPVNVFAEAVATKSALICCVPSFVEVLSISFLKDLALNIL